MHLFFFSSLEIEDCCLGVKQYCFSGRLCFYNKRTVLLSSLSVTVYQLLYLPDKEIYFDMKPHKAHSYVTALRPAGCGTFP